MSSSNPTVLARRAERPKLSASLQACLADHFDVEHSTFQIEPAEHADRERHPRLTEPGSSPAPRTGRTSAPREEYRGSRILISRRSPLVAPTRRGLRTRARPRRGTCRGGGLASGRDAASRPGSTWRTRPRRRVPAAPTGHPRRPRCGHADERIVIRAQRRQRAVRSRRVRIAESGADTPRVLQPIRTRNCRAAANRSTRSGRPDPAGCRRSRPPASACSLTLSQDSVRMPRRYARVRILDDDALETELARGRERRVEVVEHRRDGRGRRASVTTSLEQPAALAQRDRRDILLRRVDSRSKT